MDIYQLGEFGLIEHLTADFKSKNSSTIYGVGDDAAVIDVGEKYKLDESFGFGISGRFGYRWERFFTEMQMDFIKSDIQKIEFGNLPLRSSGQSDHLGFNFKIS